MGQTAKPNCGFAGRAEKGLEIMDKDDHSKDECVSSTVVALIGLRQSIEEMTERLDSRLEPIGDLLDRFIADRLETDKVTQQVLAAMIRGEFEVALECMEGKAAKPEESKKKPALREFQNEDSVIG